MLLEMEISCCYTLEGFLLAWSLDVHAVLDYDASLQEREDDMAFVVDNEHPSPDTAGDAEEG